MSDWVIWSEEHGGWWLPGSTGYTRSLQDAGRYSEGQAKLIEDTANRFLPEGRINEVAMPDPWPLAIPLAAPARHGEAAPEQDEISPRPARPRFK